MKNSYDIIYFLQTNQSEVLKKIAIMSKSDYELGQQGSQLETKCQMCSIMVYHAFQDSFGQAYCHPCLFLLVVEKIQKIPGLYYSLVAESATFQKELEEFEQKIQFLKSNSTKQISKSSSLSIPEVLKQISKGCLLCWNEKKIKKCKKQLRQLHQLKGVLKLSKQCLSSLDSSLDSYSQHKDKKFLKGLLNSWSKKSCIVCESKTPVQIESWNLKQFQMSLCNSCFAYHKKRLLENKSDVLESASSYEKCCKCSQQVTFNNKKIQQFFLYKWLDREIYCNLCLIEWFEKLRQTVTHQISSIYDKTELYDKQIKLYEKFNFSFGLIRSHFIDHCFCCGIKFQTKTKRLSFLQQYQSDLRLSLCLTCFKKIQDTLHSQRSFLKFLDFKEIIYSKKIDEKSQKMIRKINPSSRYLLHSVKQQVVQEASSSKCSSNIGQNQMKLQNKEIEMKDLSKIYIQHYCLKQRNPTQKLQTNSDSERKFKKSTQKSYIQADESSEQHFSDLNEQRSNPSDEMKQEDFFVYNSLQEPLQPNKFPQSNKEPPSQLQQTQTHLNYSSNSYKLEEEQLPQLTKVFVSPEIYQDKPFEFCKVKGCRNQQQFLILGVMCEQHFLQYLSGFNIENQLPLNQREIIDQERKRFALLEKVYQQDKKRSMR